jgi:hypothetical protein
MGMDCLFRLKSFLIPTMSTSSRPKKLKAKPKFQELKLVQTVSRSGFDTIKTEEVQTPRRGLKNGQSTSQPQQSSSSPTKRPKLGHFDEGPIPWNLEEDETSGKRQTLVFVGFFMVGISD